MVSSKHSYSFVVRPVHALLLIAMLSIPLVGCATQQYHRLRREGQKAMLAGMYYPARDFFKECDFVLPRRLDNLHDLGSCSILLAREKFERNERAAALRDVDEAIDYYSQALEIHPGHQPSLKGKNVALELKGQFDAALKHAEWAAKFVGPAAQQYIFLAQEREERGDEDGALLAYKQAVAMESNSPQAHVAFAKFLLKHGHEAKAVDHLQDAYRLDPTNEWVMDELASRGVLPTLSAPVRTVDSPG